MLRNCHFPVRLTLLSDFYYYSFQWKHRGPQWAHPEATIYRGSKTLLPNSLRMGLQGEGWALLARFRRWRELGTLANAGWHCSSCFATVAEMQTKMHSFSHQELDKPENNNARAIMSRVRMGQACLGARIRYTTRSGQGNWMCRTISWSKIKRRGGSNTLSIVMARMLGSMIGRLPCGRA